MENELDTILTMPVWSLFAAGYITDPDHDVPAALQERLRAVLADPAHGTQISTLHVDGDQPVRVALHTG